MQELKASKLTSESRLSTFRRPMQNIMLISRRNQRLCSFLNLLANKKSLILTGSRNVVLPYAVLLYCNRRMEQPPSASQVTRQWLGKPLTTATGNQPGISRHGTDLVNSEKVEMGNGRQCKGVGKNR